MLFQLTDLFTDCSNYNFWLKKFNCRLSSWENSTTTWWWIHCFDEALKCEAMLICKHRYPARWMRPLHDKTWPSLYSNCLAGMPGYKPSFEQEQRFTIPKGLLAIHLLALSPQTSYWTSWISISSLMKWE